jgi:hypothetical protein
MEIKFKINWHFIVEKVGLFILAYLFTFLFIFAFVLIGISTILPTQDPKSLSPYLGAFFLLIMIAGVSLMVWIRLGSFAYKHTTDGKWTIGGLKSSLGHYSDFQPTNINSIGVENDCPDKKCSKKLVTLKEE